MDSMWDYRKVCELLLACGRNAVAKRAGLGFELKGDGSLVTIVDQENEAFLKEQLKSVDADVWFIGEETVQQMDAADIAKALSGRCWVVDPIDGTAPYAHGFPLWGVSVGYMVGGVLVDGAVILPDTREVLTTCGDKVLYASNFDLRQRAEELNFAALPCPTDKWSDGGMLMLGQRFTREGACPLPNPVLSSGSAVQALSAVMCGKAQAYIGHMKLWDIAGVLPMMRCLGISGRLFNGGELVCDIRNGVFFLEDDDNKHRWALTDSVCIARDAILDELSLRLKR